MIVNDQLAGTTLFITQVASAVLGMANIILLVVTRLLVTTRLLCHAYILTVHDGLFIVCAPTVNAGVIVRSRLTTHLSVIEYQSYIPCITGVLINSLADATIVCCQSIVSSSSVMALYR